MAITPEAAIRLALSEEDVDRVLELIRSGLVTPDGAFERAVELEASPSVMRALIDAGADVNRKLGDYREPPLHVAARRGDVGLYRVLRTAKASVSALDESGYTLLHSVACGGHIMLMSDVLACGLDVNATNDAGETPLSVAMVKRPDDTTQQAEAKARKVVEVLLRGGARPDARALREATELGFLGIVERLKGLTPSGAAPPEAGTESPKAKKKPPAPRRRRNRSSRPRW